MGYGDEILAAGQAQRLFDSTGDRVEILDVARRRRWHPIWDGNPVIVKPHDVGQPKHAIVSAPHARPYIVYPFTEESGWTFNKAFAAREHIAKIYLTADERQFGQRVADDGPFVLVDPWSKHVNLRWPVSHWQVLVNHLLTQYRVVQHVWGDAPVLHNVETVQTPSFRLACAVLSYAALYVRGESGMCHAAAALDVPNVVIWGSCMDWDVLGGYPTQLGVGVGDRCCGRWLPCPHCKQAMYEIDPLQVIRATRNQLACYSQTA